MRQAKLEDMMSGTPVCVWNETYNVFEKDRSVIGITSKDTVLISVPPYTPDANEIVKLENVYVYDEYDSTEKVDADKTKVPVYKEVKTHFIGTTLAGTRVNSVIIDEERNHIKIFFDEGKVLHIKPDLNVSMNKNVWLGIKTYVTMSKVIGYRDCG